MKELENFSNKLEQEMKVYWKKNNIQEKAREENAKLAKGFYFMDGPPYATGHIHMGTALNKVLKDTAIRFWRMKQFHVFDRPGYDTHGVPIEHKIEQEHGFKNKKDIEGFGVKKFVDECREFATKFIETMNEEFQDLGVWMDWRNPYLTLSNEYIEAVWFAFKKAYEKDLLYLDKYPAHVCSRCDTPVAYNEIEYTKISDPSIYIKFKLNKKGKENENKFLVIWTTTPWTLPGNTGVMVHPDFDYSFVKVEKEEWIIAKELVEKVMQISGVKDFKTVKTVKGKELEGLTYFNPLRKIMKLPELENAYRVILSSRYVNLEEGSGLVHTAPGHGKEDYLQGKEAGLPVISPVNTDGTLKEVTGELAGLRAKKDDEKIIEKLESLQALIASQKYKHDYPICWRCKTPLLMMSIKQWFFRVTAFREKMLEENKKVNWVPSWMSDRFGNWLESLSDWPVSRTRYWGTPLPIWLCNSCNEQLVVAAVSELIKAGAKINEEIDLHKPEIDEVTLPCRKCKGIMHRTPEVLDVWFDSGVSSWGALSFPGRKDLFEKFWPANLNIEGTDQVRGWWNSQMILSTICFDEKPFENIAVHGMVLGAGKLKMSKSLGNVVAPSEVIEKYSRSHLRYFLLASSKGEDFEFKWDEIKEINKFFNVLWNTYNFVNLYLELNPINDSDFTLNDLQAEDKWIASKFNSLILEVDKNFSHYTYSKGLSLINEFVLEELSRTYIKLVRERLSSESKEAVTKTLNYLLFNLLKVLSPVTPHLTEYLYQNMKKKGMKESIHFYEFPEAREEFINPELENELSKVKEITQIVLALREENKLRLRWTLNEVIIKSGKEFLKNTKHILAKACNVKKVSETAKKPKGKFAEKELNELTVYLDLHADKELKDEWEARELIRRIQDKRKQSKLNPNDKVKIKLFSDDQKFLSDFKKLIESETNSEILIEKEKKTGKGKEAETELEKLIERSFSIEI
ncbi:MAG TPA: isoleucine--tRNA ligase [archaeon]|nr:isoleucine--tRNA ligase [archaeon]